MRRPHKTLYDATTDLFYVHGAFSQTIFCYKNIGGNLVEQYNKHLGFLEGSYCRSINIIDGYMYFISELGKIFKTNYISQNYEVISTYIMPPELVFMDDVNKIGSYFYVSVMGGNLVRTQNLDSLETSTYEDLSNNYGIIDNPYFASYFDGKIYFTEVGETQNSIIEVNPNDINDFRIVHRFIGITEEDIKRRELYPR